MAVPYARPVLRVGGYIYIYIYIYIGSYCGYVCVSTVGGKRGGLLLANPSLQVLRAGTMVERFTARMHVCSSFWLGRGVPENLFGTKFGKVKVGCKIRNFENVMKYCRC